MASWIKIINEYRPRVELRRTVQRPELSEYIARRTGLNEGEIIMMLLELRDAILFFNNQGYGVKLEGLGTFLPNIELDGTFDVQYRADVALKRGLNAGNFSGKINNRRNIGKPPEELAAMWNAAHPDDPVSW